MFSAFGKYFLSLFANFYSSLSDPENPAAAIALVWLCIGVALAALVWPRRVGRTRSRQIIALAALGFREGLRMKLLWTVLILALIPGTLAYFSDGDGTHAGRARLILNTCIASGEILGACLVVLLAALSMAREIESRIMHTLGAKPVPRWTILAGKALGFWALDLCFLLVLIFFSAVLVRAVPLRAETRATQLAATGTWDDLKRNALTTRTYTNASDSAAGQSELKFIKPGASRAWQFLVPPDPTDTARRSLRFSISSTHQFAPHIQGVRIVASDSGKRVVLDRTETIPQGRVVEFHFNPGECPRSDLTVTITATDTRPGAPSLIVARPSGVRLGTDADAFAAVLLKSFLLMALQGWVLALIATGWSGVLSFPVTAALGLLLVLGGEMSRHAIELLQSEVERINAAGLQTAVDSAFNLDMIERLKTVLKFLPDFQAAGGPAAFVEGTYISVAALGHAALWMGVVRGLLWALPGVWAFQRREVGK